MKDDSYTYNYDRWESLAKVDALFTRPYLDLDKEKAYQYLGLDRLGIKKSMEGKKVLCLASGGGQQSVAFALLGAEVSVLDLSPSQLKQDKKAAKHYGLSFELVQGDMRDLSHFKQDTFDLVWQPYSINFVPDSRLVFHEVSRIIKEGGIYYLMCSNPFFSGLTHSSWNGEGYNLNMRYEDERLVSYPDQEWVYDEANEEETINEPKEYTQTFSRLFNTLIKEGFLLKHFSEINNAHPDSPPGSWEHFTSVAPPWIESVWYYHSDMWT